MKRYLVSVLLALFITFLFTDRIFAGTDKYNDGSWRITSGGDLLPYGNEAVTIGSGTSYPSSLRLNAISKKAWVTTTHITAGATPSIDLSTADIFTLTPINSQNETITLTGASTIPGHRASIVITSTGANAETIWIASTNCKVSDTMTASATNGKVTTITFGSDGTNWNELSRVTSQM
jgi:hypothetical protein